MNRYGIIQDAFSRSILLIMAAKGRVALFAVMLWVAISSAESAECTLKELRYPNTTSQASENFNCLLSKILSLQQELDKSRQSVSKLEEELRPYRGFKGAVIAFDRGQGEALCPEGWSLFQSAAGRFIVGAGQHSSLNLTTYPSFQENPSAAIGGEEKHKLTINEIPPHKHLGRTTSTDGIWGSVGADCCDPGAFRPRVTSYSEPPHSNAQPEAGPAKDHGHSIETDMGVNLGGEAHENRPPFIALYYCRRD